MTKRKAQPEGMVIESLRPGLAEIERLIEYTAAKFGGFPNGGHVVPTIATTGKKAACYGWFLAPKTVEVGGKPITASPWSTREGHNVAELLINPEYLNRDPFAIAATVIHESVHLYNYACGDQDCSKSGVHNEKVFKPAAELFGLDVEKSEKRGWNVTSLTEDLRHELEHEFQLDIGAFQVFKNVQASKVKAPSKTVKFMCSAECGNSTYRAVDSHKAGDCGECGAEIVQG